MKTYSRCKSVAGIAIVVSTLTANAAEAPMAVLTTDRALKAAQAAIDECQRSGYQVSAAVVDQSGVMLAQLRNDAAGPHAVDSSRRKAYSAASLRESTATLAQLVASKPELQGLHQMNDSILILGGGLPIRLNGRVAGGIGVGGAPGTHLDEACARAGLAAIGADGTKAGSP